MWVGCKHHVHQLLPGLSWISRQRGQKYGEAAVRMSEDPAWDKDQIEGDGLRHEEPPEYKRVCYYNLLNSGSFNTLTPDMLSPDLCTHINIAFATVVNGTIQPMYPSDIEVRLVHISFKFTLYMAKNSVYACKL